MRHIQVQNAARHAACLHLPYLHLLDVDAVYRLQARLQKFLFVLIELPVVFGKQYFQLSDITSQIPEQLSPHQTYLSLRIAPQLLEPEIRVLCLAAVGPHFPANVETNLHRIYHLDRPLSGFVQQSGGSRAGNTRREYRRAQ